MIKESVSVLDVFKIGIGPSSSHTYGPWMAAKRFIAENHPPQRCRIKATLFGSLAKTGIGHGTNLAILWGLFDLNPATVELSILDKVVANNKLTKMVENLSGSFLFDFDNDIIFKFDEKLPQHPNAVKFEAINQLNEVVVSNIYFSVGGGAVLSIAEMEKSSEKIVSNQRVQFPVDSGADALKHCKDLQFSLHQLTLLNESFWRTEYDTLNMLDGIIETMLQSIYLGCTTTGLLPGGLWVNRRAPELLASLHISDIQSFDGLFAQLLSKPLGFDEIIRVVTMAALAVNEQNASFGRIVTAPTNGSAGVIPAVMLYLMLRVGHKNLNRQFLLTAGEIGSIFKKGATISAAMGGCQAEIGVSAAMAAAGLVEALGGNVKQALMAAEITMEHHLGLTCDPVKGLVQIPCIERNSMGAVKAITAATLALSTNPAHARVSLDEVVNTMMQTALDMNEKYKETSEGGLAVNISVNIPNC